MANLEQSTNTRDDLSSIDNTSYLSIFYQDYKLGISYYHVGARIVQLLHQVHEYNDFSIIKCAIQQLEPTNIIVSSECNAELLQMLLKNASNSSQVFKTINAQVLVSVDCSDQMAFMDQTMEQSTTFFDKYTFTLHINPSRCYSYDNCKNNVLALNLKLTTNIIDSKERFIVLSSHIEFSETNVIKSTGNTI